MYYPAPGLHFWSHLSSVPVTSSGLFQHVLFQDSTFYDRISASELAM